MNSEQHYVLGYGSLMSHDSRFRYSNINSKGVPVILSGWERGWVTSCKIENFTSVGAIQNSKEEIGALLVPVEEISSELQNREKNYRFTAVDQAQVRPFFNNDSVPQEQAKFWVCEVLNPSQACHRRPIFQSYVDTCLVGCLESANESFASHFIETTFGWDVLSREENASSMHWIDDRDGPQYPRAANVPEPIQNKIDELLRNTNILHHRFKGK